MKDESRSGREESQDSRHLWAVLLAVLTVVVVFAGVEAFVRWRLAGELEAFAGIMPSVKLTGNVLAAAALRRADFLLVYGSSELDHDAENRPDAFFQYRPTGFAVFPIGKAGNTCLVVLQKVAALGKRLRGRKVVVILSPSWFLHDPDPEAVGANLRPPQVGAWVFGSGLDAALRRDIARRLQAFPAVLEREPLLGRAVADLAENSWGSRLRLAALTPLGRAQDFLWERWEFLAVARDLPTGGASRRQRQKASRKAGLPPPRSAPNWERLAAEAERHDRALGDGSPYSVGVPEREEKVSEEMEGRSGKEAVPRERDADFLAKLARSSEWTDLGLLLRVLREEGAEALIVSQPFNGRYRDPGGNTPAARRVYYARLEATVRAAGFAVRDFPEDEEDRTFFNDAGHPSAKGWVFYDRALDEFFHGR